LAIGVAKNVKIRPNEFTLPARTVVYISTDPAFEDIGSVALFGKDQVPIAGHNQTFLRGTGLFAYPIHFARQVLPNPAPVARFRRDHSGEITKLHRIDDYEGGVEMLERIVARARSTLGALHPKVSFHLNELGLLFRELGLFKEAEASFRQAAEVDDLNVGEQHPSDLCRQFCLRASPQTAARDQ
jgi:hypothetical protein